MRQLEVNCLTVQKIILSRPRVTWLNFNKLFITAVLYLKQYIAKRMHLEPENYALFCSAHSGMLHEKVLLLCFHCKKSNP